MTYARWYATSTTLPDGRVLATSGDAPDGTRSNIPEIYNPATDSWTQVITANKDLGLYPLMYVLPNGKAYAAGTNMGALGTYYIDPNANSINPTFSWTTTNNVRAAIYSFKGAAPSARIFLPLLGVG